MTHAELVDIGYRWVLKNASCGVALKEVQANTSTGEQPDVIGFGSRGHSVLIECKATRPDYLADKKKPFRKQPHKGMGRYRLYLCPEGLIQPNELPEGWGLLYVNERGQVKLIRNTSAFKQNLLAEHGLLYSGLRREQ